MASRSRSAISLLARALAAKAPESAALPAARAVAIAALQQLPAHQPSIRHIATSTPSMSAGLVSILQEEVKHEKQTYAAPDTVKAGPPAPFKLGTEKAGDTLLTLTRSHNGEEIAVDLHVNNQPEPEYEGGEEGEATEPITSVVFNVSVVKADEALVFECESDGTYVSVLHVSHEPKDGFESESSYTGPVFDELDEVLQRELRSYLEERGVTPELGEYLRHAIYDKEQREYMRWLERVAAFVQRK